MLPSPDSGLPPRTRRLLQRIALTVALTCLLGLLATTAGGAAPPPGPFPAQASSPE
ncbi:hypothetical protein [Nodosilinea nodulosa]|uniref:hypothetical protein n=1 Tax=Nodosilinea nodulosa TaxID=416001 RepID=UPI0002EFC412|nr:hypothetical protein [Nodosilinea nodulosa]